MTATSCVVSGCDKPPHGRGLCVAHYTRMRRHGEPTGGGAARQPAKPVCIVDGCDKRVLGRGYCSCHYSHFRKYGDPLGAKYKWGARSRHEWHVTSHGYVWRYVGYDYPGASPNGFVYQHRDVMAHMLGRPLQPFETVHHKNGNRADNRPENLELWAKSQPAGQRVEDLVAWAKQILATYPAT